MEKQDFSFLLAESAAGRALSADRLRRLLPFDQADLLDILAAARLGTTAGGRKRFTCGIVNAKSGRCQENCAFCAQSGHHAAAVGVYPLIDADEMLSRAEKLSAAGVDFMGMVTSGTKPTARDFDNLCEMARRIRSRVDIRLCASLGLLGKSEAKTLAGAGFTSCHHNLETARSHYPAVCPSHSYEDRVETIRNAKAAGLRVCSGGIFGVGESWEQRLELSAELADLDVDSIPVNFLVPIPGTPMESSSPPSAGEALLIIALFRFMHPGRDVVVCGGRSALGRFEPLLFLAGANGLMVGDYLTTRGAGLRADMEMLRTLGMSAEQKQP